MPELPEVETIVRDLRALGLEGKKIKKATVYWPKIIEIPTVDQFCKRIQNQFIRKLYRRGKYLVFELSSDTLLIHLRMTGKFNVLSEKVPHDKHEHVCLTFEDGTILSYHDTRKFGRWSLYSDASEKLNQLGLEPLSEAFTLKAFENMMQSHSAQIKPFLLNQSHVAGMGNIYVDEALWKAKIHPQSLTNHLSKKNIKELHRAIRDVLEVGIKNQGTSLGVGKGNYFSVSGRRGGHQHHLKIFRRDREPCPRCGEIIKKMVVAQRGTHYCPSCQKINCIKE